jgi:hypothetical protein
VPNGGHTFVNWTQNGKVVSTSPTYTFTLPSANVTLARALERLLRTI